MAEKINAKLGYRPVPTIEEEEKEQKEQDAPPAETFKRYEEELEINDFPQTARWKVTSKACAVTHLGGKPPSKLGLIMFTCRVKLKFVMS